MCLGGSCSLKGYIACKGLRHKSWHNVLKYINLLSKVFLILGSRLHSREKFYFGNLKTDLFPSWLNSNFRDNATCVNYGGKK